MSRNRNFQPPQRKENHLTMSDDALVMTEEELEAQTRPNAPNGAVTEMDALGEEVTLNDVVEDPSATGIIDEEIPGEVVQVTDEAPLVPVVDIKAEELKNRAVALKQFKVMPRVTQRLRVPHPNGKQAMWLNLTRGQTIIVPKYVRDHLWEKGLL